MTPRQIAVIGLLIGLPIVLIYEGVLLLSSVSRMEERLTAEIRREDFSVAVQDLSNAERLRYIAILSDPCQVEAPVPTSQGVPTPSPTPFPTLSD